MKYVVTQGFHGPVAAGPYEGYEAAVKARDAMPRWRVRRRWLPWRREVVLWVEPLDGLRSTAPSSFTEDK